MEAVDDTTQGISTAMSGRASSKGRGAGAVGVSTVSEASDWLAAGDDADEEGGSDVNGAVELLNGGVAGSKNR